MRWHWVMVSMAILFLVPMGSAEGAEKVTASGERYVVVLAEEVRETEAARLASVYGGVIEPDDGHGGRQFVVRMAASRARMMSLDPHVLSVSEQSRHLTPHPTGSGSTTLGPYAYDGSGNIRSIGPAGSQEQYVYDALGRLTSATAGVTNTQTYQYDAFGNRTVVTRTGSNCTGDTACEQQATYLPETNHLNNNGAVYDAAGNLTAYVADQYAYDAAGMLAPASVSGDRQYLYTAFDERIAVYDGTFNWRWTLRSEDGKVLREFTSTNDPSTAALGVANRQWVKDYVWRDGQLLATENRKVGGGTVTEHYHLDHLGTPRLVTDGTGLKLATHTYYAFGAELMGTPESPETAMKFTGHERDITGTSDALDNMHARYYSSLRGRFLAIDPVLGNPFGPQSWNRYSYALNNPINITDPTGLEPCKIKLTGSDAKTAGVADGAEVDSECVNANAPTKGEQAMDVALDTIDMTLFDLVNMSGGGNVLTGIYNDNPIQIAKGYGQQLMIAAPGGIAAGLKPLAGAGSLVFAEASPLAKASQAAFAAADGADAFNVSAKHLAGAGGRYAKFASDVNPVELIKEGLRSGNAMFLPNGEGSFQVITNVGRVIGSRGETTLKIVVDYSGKIWTAYPIK